jgi:hypothetical protein
MARIGVSGWTSFTSTSRSTAEQSASAANEEAHDGQSAWRRASYRTGLALTTATTRSPMWVTCARSPALFCS